MHELRFSYNWNNKLNCKRFTTLRLASPKYVVGSDYLIKAKGTVDFVATCLDIKYIKIYDIDEYQASLDTGYSKEETILIVERMYRYKPINLMKANFVLCLLERKGDNHV